MLSLQTKVFPEVFKGQFDVSKAASEITIEHLLDHKVGHWPTTTRTNDPMFCKKDLNLKQLIQSVLKETKIKADELGKTYLYSNFGYCILGRVVE